MSKNYPLYYEPGCYAKREPEPQVIRYNYTVCGWVLNPLQSLTVDARAIAAEFDRRGETWPAYFSRLVGEGCQYSYEDFDVLSAAMRQLEKSDPGIWRRIGTAA